VFMQIFYICTRKIIQHEIILRQYANILYNEYIHRKN